MLQMNEQPTKPDPVMPIVIKHKNIRVTIETTTKKKKRKKR